MMTFQNKIIHLTIGQLKEATCSTTINASKFLLYVNETCQHYSINTPIRELCFLCQVGHESGGLFYTEELASGEAYEGRRALGNLTPGDGIRFKGRGLIQITGRTNYKAIGDNLKVNFINNPTLLGGKNINTCTVDQLRYAALSAGWYWNSRNLNAIADLINIKKPVDTNSNLEHFKLITRKINGGYNGLHDRLNRFKNGVKYF